MYTVIDINMNVQNTHDRFYCQVKPIIISFTKTKKKFHYNREMKKQV